MMKKSAAAFALFATTAFGLEDRQPRPSGYYAGHPAIEAQWEQKFSAIPDAERIRENSRHAPTNYDGSAYDKENAEWMAGQLHSSGFDEQFEAFGTLHPTPRLRKLEFHGPAP